MKIKMTTLWAHPKGMHRVGDIVEVSAEEAKRLIEGHHAVPVKATGAELPRTADESAKETADTNTNRRK